MAKVGRVAATDYNKAASGALKRIRELVEMSQGEFAEALSDKMKLKGRRRFKQSTLSGWELGTRGISAGVLLAAAELADVFLLSSLNRVIVERLRDRVAALEKAQEGNGIPNVMSAGIRRDVKRARRRNT